MLSCMQICWYRMFWRRSVPSNFRNAYLACIQFCRPRKIWKQHNFWKQTYQCYHACKFAGTGCFLYSRYLACIHFCRHRRIWKQHNVWKQTYQCYHASKFAGTGCFQDGHLECESGLHWILPPPEDLETRFFVWGLNKHIFFKKLEKKYVLSETQPPVFFYL